MEVEIRSPTDPPNDVSTLDLVKNNDKNKGDVTQGAMIKSKQSFREAVATSSQ